MTGLLNLPNEVVLQICELLCLHCRSESRFDLASGDPSSEDRAALLALTYTCKSLRAPASTILPHVVFSLSRPRAFWDRLLGDSDFASQVKYFDATEWEGAMAGHWDELQKEDITRFKATITPSGLNSSDDFATDWINPNTEAQSLGRRSLDATLCLLPCLQQVYLCNNPSDTDEEWADVFPARARLSLFTQLEHLSLRHWDTEGGQDLQWVASLFAKAPNLTRLSLHMLLSCPPALTLGAVRDLTVDFGAPSAEDMRNLLAACGPLTYFSYTSGGSLVSQYGNAPELCNPAVLLDLVRLRSAESLRKLILDFTNASEDEDDVDGGGRLLGLRHFVNLEVLDLDTCPATGEEDWFSNEDGSDQNNIESGFIDLVGMLPDSIRDLVVIAPNREVEASLAQAMHRFSRQANITHTRLQSISVVDGAVPSVYLASWRAFSEAGINFEIIGS